MKVLIELPTWLGDSVMATPALENLVNHFKELDIYLIGSFASVEVLKNHPKVRKTYVWDKKFINFFQILKKFNNFDIFISFRGSSRSKIIKFFIKSKVKHQFDKKKYKIGHQVEKYNNFINDSLNIISSPGELVLHNKVVINSKKNKILGINPGASYGDAKRWYPKKFANIAIELSNQFDIVIMGGSDEKVIAQDIEMYLVQNGIKNYQNLATKTNIEELISQISNLDLFITGDSGPMHLASALKIPTIAIFGPTNHNETSQWMNEKSIIVKKDLDCQPCMKRTCPLKHNNCMSKIKSSDVLREIKNLN
jgi:heptosyltransferase II|tara:strand:+ start:86 stop:1012 length:927 start_codon:yes stop_codon:yes gene_type:complete